MFYINVRTDLLYRYRTYHIPYLGHMMAFSLRYPDLVRFCVQKVRVKFTTYKVSIITRLHL